MNQSNHIGHSFHLIGNPPSCGSTLLCDIIDSDPWSACGPELEIFCNRRLYQFADYQKYAKSSLFFSTHSTGIYPQWDRLGFYGTSRNEVVDDLRTSESLHQFVEKMRLRFLSFRGKQSSAQWFEKTPQNANAIGEFLMAFPEGHFVTIIRNPIFVYRSLLNRGKGNFGSLITWLLYVSKLFPFLNHERFHLIKYEDLVRNPFVTVSSLLNTIYNGKRESVPAILEENYAKNKYRAGASTKLKSWSTHGSKQVVDGNTVDLKKQHLLGIKKLLLYRVSETYSELFDLAPISFREALDAMGYMELIEKETAYIALSDTDIKLEFYDHRKLVTKWIRELIRGNLKLNHLGDLYSPLERL
ncbi:MAG: sulfotransferase [Saprospiraceae bacterium]|nr:sulfotransferase [Saprospiraceae bacterium]